MYVEMMNSSRARPTPSLGRNESRNASSGLPTFIMISGLWARQSPEVLTLAPRTSSRPRRRSRYPPRRRDGDLLAVAEQLGAPLGADDGRQAQLAADDGGVAGPAAAIGDDGRRLLHRRFPVGIGLVGDEDLAVAELVQVLHALDRRAPVPGRSSRRRSGR